jgi:hypothetical protein
MHVHIPVGSNPSRSWSFSSSCPSVCLSGSKDFSLAPSSPGMSSGSKLSSEASKLFSLYSLWPSGSKLYVCMYVCVYVSSHPKRRSSFHCIRSGRLDRSCMYVCMYVCTYVCMYICICVCKFSSKASKLFSLYSLDRSCICMYMFMYMHMYVYVHMCMYICMYMCVVHTYTSTKTYA